MEEMAPGASFNFLSMLTSQSEGAGIDVGVTSNRK